MEYDCVIALANEMDRHGTLNDESNARISAASSFILDGKSNSLICCGWDYRRDTDLTIAEALKTRAVELGVDADMITCEKESRDTVGDAYFTKRKIVNSKKCTKILVVTSDYHVNRTQRIFELFYGDKYAIEVVGVGKFESEEKQEAERKSLLAFEKTFSGIQPGDDEILEQRLIQNHPFYNGKVYPKLVVV